MGVVTWTERRVAAAVTLSSTLLLVAVAVWLVPWQPVPGGAPPPVDRLSVFTAAEVARAESYAWWSRVWSWSALALSLAVAAVLGFSPLGPRLMAALRGPWWVRVVLGVGAVSLVGRLATLPSAAMMQRHRLANGLSTQPWGGWVADLVKGEAIGVVTTSLALLVVFAAARRWRRAWPAVTAVLLGAMVVLGSFVYPLLVEPLFNSFTPLPDGELRREILALADTEGVPVEDVLVADASRRTTSLNAYVSGFGGTRRVVVYDTLVQSLPREQALSVVAHELAHARHGDVVVGTTLGALGAGVGVGLLGLVLGTRAGRAQGRMGEAALVPLVLALLAFGTLAASPVENAVSRRIETRADADALAATRDPGAFVAMQRVLALRALADPTPPAWSQWWWGSHPTVLQRVALARAAQVRG